METVLTSKNNKKEHLNLYQEITNRIIALLEQGISPWKKTWSTYGLARNYLTGNIYSGINFILLNNTGHKIPYFLTFNQVKKLNGYVSAGAKAEKVVYFNLAYYDANDVLLDYEEAKILIKQGEDIRIEKYIKYYLVFSLDDVLGIEFNFPEVKLNANEKIERCEEIIQGMPYPPKITCIDTNQAFYDPIEDLVNMPQIEQFTTSEEYYSVLFHELIHSTGHKDRLAREEVVNSTGFGTMPYSKEEIIAELGNSYLCAKASIDNDKIVENNASYLKGWINILKEDNKYIFQIASLAQRASNYVLNV